MAELPPNLRRGVDLFHKIESDRICATCKYNLKGLSTGDRCPECGTPTVATASVSDEQWISHAPFSFLQPFSKGAMLTGVMVPIQVVAVALMILFSQSTAIALIASITGIVYAIGVTLLTVARVGTEGREKITEWAMLRMSSRASQWGWSVGALAIAGAAAISNKTPVAPASAVFVTIGSFSLLIAICGLVPLLIYLVRIAQWAGDSEFADRLRMLPFLLPVSVAISGAAGLIVPIMTGGAVTFLLIPIAGVSVLFLLFGGFTSLRTCWNLASLGFWVMKNREESLASTRRRSARIVDRIESAQAKRSERGSEDQAPIDLA